MQELKFQYYLASFLKESRTVIKNNHGHSVFSINTWVFAQIEKLRMNAQVL